MHRCIVSAFLALSLVSSFGTAQAAAQETIPSKKERAPRCAVHPTTLQPIYTGMCRVHPQDLDTARKARQSERNTQMGENAQAASTVDVFVRATGGVFTPVPKLVKVKAPAGMAGGEAGATYHLNGDKGFFVTGGVNGAVSTDPVLTTGQQMVTLPVTMKIAGKTQVVKTTLPIMTKTATLFGEVGGMLGMGYTFDNNVYVEANALLSQVWQRNKTVAYTPLGQVPHQTEDDGLYAGGRVKLGWRHELGNGWKADVYVGLEAKKNLGSASSSLTGLLGTPIAGVGLTKSFGL